MAEPSVAFPIITVSGSPYECGKQYGEAVADLIHQNLNTYLRLFEHAPRLTREAAAAKARSFIPTIEQFNPEFLDEMQGIADGAGLILDDVLMLNTRTELLFNTGQHECTSLAVLPPASSGNVWLAQNWDWYTAMLPYVMVLRVEQDGKPALTMLVEAGQIGKAGFNDSGVGLCINWLEVNYQQHGVPLLMLCREVLNQSEIGSAIDAVYRRPRASAGNFLIAHSSGFAIDLEMTPDDVDYIEPEGGILVHSNHYVSPRLRPFDNSFRHQNGDSIVRRQRVTNFLRRESGHIDRNIIYRIQSDTSCGYSSVCIPPRRHEHEMVQWSTLARITMNLSTLEFEIATGSSIETPYTALSGELE